MPRLPRAQSRKHREHTRCRFPPHRYFALRHNVRVKVENDSAPLRLLVARPEGTGELRYRRTAPRTLEPVHTEVLTALRGRGDSMSDVARTFGVSAATISRLAAQAEAKRAEAAVARNGRRGESV